MRESRHAPPTGGRGEVRGNLEAIRSGGWLKRQLRSPLPWLQATVRVRRGIDIDAGCGQLAERALQDYEVPAALPA